ncbi:MAG: hypothetical protein AB7F40_05585 [Victivallaceae bacterium]|nr:hypothetical protein [Victivallaceae bacterium]
MTRNFVDCTAGAWTQILHRFRPARVYFILLTLLVAAGMIPLLMPGIPKGHDLNFHLNRLAALAEGLKAGHFPVWINFNALEGFGYGTGLFYPDLYLYFPASLAALGISTLAAYKILLFGWSLFTAWSMFHAARRISGDAFAAFCAALLYSISSFYAVDVFTRAALGEVLAFPFLPWIMLGLWEIIYAKPENFYPLTLGFAGLYYAHQISFVLAGIIAFLWCLLNVRRFLREPRRIFYLATAALFGGMLVLAAAAPMLEQLRSIKFNLTGHTMTSPLAQRAVPLTRLVLELPYMKTAYWLPPGIGIVLVLAAVQRFRFKSTGSAMERFRDVCLITGLFSLLAATEFLPWEGMFRMLAAIQFPWRFYLPATAFLALGGGLTIGTLAGRSMKRRRNWLFILLFGCWFAYGFNVCYTYAAKIHEKNIAYGVDDSVTSGEVSGLHYVPRGVSLDRIAARGKGVIFPDGAPGIMEYNAVTHELSYSGATGGETVEFPLIPYVGYTVEFNAEGRHLKLPVDATSGFLRARLPDCPSGTVTAAFTGTMIQKYAPAASAMILVILLVMRMLCFRKRCSAK